MDDQHDAQDCSDDDDDGDDKPEPSKKKRRPAARGKKRDLAASDDDYDGEMHDDAAPKKKKVRLLVIYATLAANAAVREQVTDPRHPPQRSSKPAPRRSSTHDVKPSTPAAVTSVPQSDKTRTHVVKQLTTIFSSIFSATGGGGGGGGAGSAGIEVRSGAFAEEVESELFDGFAEVAEVDDKGVRGPRAKYVAKFRSLHFNLKSNAYLRSRVANNELGAAKLIHLSAEDLQTPELRAMAESVRAASLRNSVKEVLAAPTAKRTHKGEEEIDNEASRIIAAEQHERAQEERDKMEVAQQKKKDERDSAAAALQSPLDAAFADSQYSAASPGAGSPGPSRDSPAAAAVRPRSSLVPTDGSPGPVAADEREGTNSGAASPGSPFDNGSPRPSARPRPSASSFDMSSIWTKAKAASPPVDSPADAAASSAPQDPMPQSDDPFDLDGAKATDSANDDFEDDLFRDPGASPAKRKAGAPKRPALDELPPVWAGDFIVPEEGGFPTFAVQVGGRPLGAAQDTWRKLLPKGLTTAGRIPTATAQKYLLDCAIAPTRELVILALLPDLTGPSTQFPHKPAADKCLAKHQHIVDQYVRRDRIGVVQPPKELGKLVKDIYVVPLRKGDDLPDFVEMVDEHVVPPSRKRDKDLVLAVLVVQKGVLPTVQPEPLAAATPPSAPPPAPTATPSFSAPPPPPPPAPFAAGASPFAAAPPSYPSSFAAGSPLPHHPPGPSSTQPPYSPPAQVGYGSPAPPFGSPAHPSTAAPPAFDPAAMQSLLAQVNPDALNSLLANPALFSGLPGFGAPPASAPAGVVPPAAHEPPASRGPPMHPSRMALLGAAPAAGSAGMPQQHQQQQQQAPAPYGAASDGGWSARQGGQGYSPPQGGGGGYGY